jgi:hypothetical protein
LENFFGFVRWDANNINTVNEIVVIIAQEADRPLELEEHVQQHVNPSGVHIDENPPHAKAFHI